MVAVLSLASPYFLTVGNIVNILLSVSVIGTMAAASTLVMISRNLDLSVASIAALAGVLTAQAMGNGGLSPAVTILIGLGVGALCGAINGFLINVCRINSIITTIGTLSVFRGAAFVITNGSTTLVDNQTLVFIGSGRVLSVPVAVWLMLLIYVSVHFVARRTRIGRSLYAIGANPRASMLAGLRLARYRLGVFVASGLSCGLAGILLNGQSGTAMPGAAVSYELLVITAVLLGGTSLQGGEGRSRRYTARRPDHRHAQQRHDAALGAELLSDGGKRHPAADRGWHRPAAPRHRPRGSRLRARRTNEFCTKGAKR